ncbi:MAG: PD-(D/E)XK nuclease family protein, partial [Clostridia bacterium]|nr:PD-(D/E)XK nuclease family protein [Clostridia bacterium]
LYRRLTRLSLLMVRNIVEEFSHSEFRPAFFELNTNGRNGNPVPIEFKLNDGYKVSFSGIIDRVDVLKKNGKVYIRIVDYKTGTKDFSLSDVAKGINIQMLLYLFTLCRNQSNFFTQSLGLEDGTSPERAGILYLSANIPVIPAEDYDSEDVVMKKAEQSLNRSGLLLAEEEILLAMNDQLSPDFLAGIKKEKGSLVGDALFKSEDFTKLEQQLRDTIAKIANEMREGNADATPMRNGNKLPCSYCQMKPICRRNEG